MAPAISISGVISSTWTYGGSTYTAHLAPNATISYGPGTMTVLYITNWTPLDGPNELLKVDTSGTSLTASSSYDGTKVRLTVQGSDTVSNYQQVLRSLYYVNNLTKPTTGNRDIEIGAFDQNTGSNTAICSLSVQTEPNATSTSTTTKKNANYTNGYAQSVATNTTSTSTIPNYSYQNNATQTQMGEILGGKGAQTLTPYVDLSGGSGGPDFYQGTTYGGPNWWSHIAPNAVVTFGGNVYSMTVTLTNRPDSSSEYLGFATGFDPSTFGLFSSGYSSYNGQLTISGNASAYYYQNALRSIVYVDTNTSPATGTRTISVRLNGGGALYGNTALSTVAVAQDPNVVATKKNANYGSGSSTVGTIMTNITKEQLTNITTTTLATPPYVNLTGENTGPSWSTWNYGGNYYTHIAPNGTISYGGSTLSMMLITAYPRPDGISEYFSVLNYDNKDKNNPISYEYNPNTGYLTVTGTASVAAYQDFLRGVVYWDTNPNPATNLRNISVRVYNGSIVSNYATLTLTLSTVPANSTRGNLIVTTKPVTAISEQPGSLRSVRTWRSRLQPFTANTFYVGLNGDDSIMNNGLSMNRPWKSIKRLNQAIRTGSILPGDTIAFRRGDVFPGTLYFGNVGGMPGAVITITDYQDPTLPPRARPVINAQDSIGIFIEAVERTPGGIGYFTITNLDIQAGDGTGILVQDAGHCEIANVDISGSLDLKKRLYNSNGNGIWFRNTTLNGPQAGLSIHDVTIHGFSCTPALNTVGGRGIFLDGGKQLSKGGGYTNISISNCDIFNNAIAAVETNQSIADYDPANKLVFSRVTIIGVMAHDNVPPPTLPQYTTVGGGNGIHLVGVENGLVQFCRAYYNGNRWYADSGDGMWCQYSSHILFQYNEAHHNRSAQGLGDEGGFDLDRWTNNCIMQFNYSHDNDGYGFMLGATGVNGSLMAENNVLRFNISMNDCRNSSWGALLFENWSASDVAVYNNTFCMGENRQTLPPAIGFNVDPGSVPIPPKIRIYNNIIYTGSGAMPFVSFAPLFPLSAFDVRTNALFNNSSQTMVPIVNGKSLGIVADPMLGFERNPATAPAIDDIRTLPMQLQAYFQLNIRLDGVPLPSVLPAGGAWWAPENFYWNGALSSRPHDFFEIPVPINGGYSIGASESVYR